MKYLKRIINKGLIVSGFIFIAVSVVGLISYSRYPLYYKDDIGRFANKYDVDPYLVAAVIDVESGFDKDAISRKNARGLMQIAEQTGEWGSKELNLDNYTKEDLFDPKINIEFGTWYLKRLEREFNGDLNLMLAAYNGGSGNINKWLKDKEYSKDGKTLDKIPFKETENYVRKVNSSYESYKTLYEGVNFEDENYDSFFLKYIYKLKSFVRK